MTYTIARNGQQYGPYSALEVERYLASGHIAATDLAQGDGMQEWLPVSALFPTGPVHVVPTGPGGLPALYPDPPDLAWWVALALEVITLGGFFAVWDIVQSVWLRRIDRSSTAYGYYIAAALIYLIKLPSMLATIAYNIFNGPPVPPHHGFIVGMSGLIVELIARYVFRRELERHFNTVEPIGLRLGWFMTLFGGVYFQYHFNRVKRALRVSVPSV